jgi:hypothetical protein
MLTRIVVCLSVLFTATNGASAAYWKWGCRGQLGEQQVIFTDEKLSIVNDKTPFSDARKLEIEDIIAAVEAAEKSGKAVAVYDNKTDDSGLVKEFEFSRDDGKQKLLLTEKSSRKIHVERHHPAGRDSYIGIFVKVFRMTRGGEPPRNITMQCRESYLSTCAGRCKVD